jgi:hypothetical protein
LREQKGNYRYTTDLFVLVLSLILPHCKHFCTSLESRKYLGRIRAIRGKREIKGNVMEDNDFPVEPPAEHLDVTDDDIVIEEEYSTEIMQKHRNSAGIFTSPDVETNAPFIPPGLSSFVAQAKRTLKDTQASLQGALQSPPPNGQDMSMDVDEDPENYSMKEDDDDRQLKRDVMQKFSTKAATNAAADLKTTPADSAKKLFVESEEKGTPKSPETLHSSRESDRKMQSFWTQAMKPTPDKELRVYSEKKVSPDAPKTPPSPRASEGSPSFWSEVIKPEPEQELHVAPEEALSAKAPETPPSPRASEGSPAFWSQPMKPQPDTELHVSPRLAVNSEDPATPPSPRASTGTHSFWGQAMGSSGAELTESKSSTPTKSNVSKTDDDDASPSPSVSGKSESVTPSKSPLMVPSSNAAKLDVTLSRPPPIESPQSSIASKDRLAYFVQAESPAGVPSPVNDEKDGAQVPAMSTSVGMPETEDDVSKAEAVATAVKEISKELPQESPSSVATMDRPPLSSPTPLQATPKVASNPPKNDEETTLVVQAAESPASERIQLDPSRAESEQTPTAASPTPRSLVKAPPETSSQPKTPAVETPLAASPPLQNADTPKMSESSPKNDQGPTPIALSPGALEPGSSTTPSHQTTAPREAPLTASMSRSKKEATLSANTPTVNPPSTKGPSSEDSAGRSIPPSAKKSASTPLASMWNLLSTTKVAPSPIAPLELDDAPAKKKAEDVSANASTSVVEATAECTAPTQAAVDDLAFLPNREAALPVEKETPQPQPAPAASNKKETAGRKKTFKSSVARARVASNSTRTTASIQSASSTASGAVRTTTTSTNVPSRLMQGTAASQARKGSSSQPTRNEASPDDGVAKARDRVKQRMQAKKVKDGAMAAKKAEGQSSTKKPSMSADDGRARARERVRQRQLQAKVKQEQSKGSRPMNPASQSSTSARAKLSTTTSRVPDYMRATASMQGRKSASGRQDRKSLSDDNPITRAFGSPTHDDKKAVDKGTSRSGRPRQLTVPQAPRLSTSSKYGDKPPPTRRGPATVEPLQATPRSTQGVTTPKPFHLHENKAASTSASRQSKAAEPSLAGSVDFMKKGLRQETPAASTKRESKLTMPKPFHFHESKHSHHPPPSEVKAEPSLAESVNMFMRKGLRDETPASKPAKREPKLTIPEAPKFAPLAQRTLPKSTAEKEEEMMKEFNSRPFKAQPVPRAVVKRRSARPLPPKAPNRSLTEPVPFHFRVDTRAAAAKPPQGSPDKEQDDLEECKKQFHARPMPKLKRHAPREPVDRQVTTPKPFNLATERRGAAAHVVAPSEDEVELKKQFHARPLPQSMYVSPAVNPRKLTTQPQLSTPASAVAGPPKLATSSRTERREAARLESIKNAERKAKEKQAMALRKQREKHHEEMVKASIRSPLAMKSMQPFHLLSESRHEAYQNQLAEQRLHEEQENRRRMSFHAKPLPKLSPAAIKVQSEHPRTEPRPFQLRSLTRHEMAQRSIRQHVQDEERERHSMTKFKARPIPLSTYEYHPVTPGQKKPLVQPFSPEFQLKQRAVERREFEEYAEHERERDASRKKALQERLQAEELEELNEKRNLPVSEGGMIPKAEPINAVFLQKTENNDSLYSS